MIDLKLSDEGDITITDKDITLTSSAGEILRQRLFVTFRTLVGEWYLNQSFGAYDTQLFTTKGITKQIADAYFLRIIREFPEIEQILSFESSLDKANRAYSMTFHVKSIEGDGTFQINFAQADSLLSYPLPEQIAEAIVCDFVSVEEANDFYILLNIDIPTTIPWD